MGGAAQSGSGDVNHTIARFAMLLIVALVLFNLYTGVALSKLSFFGIVDVEFSNAGSPRTQQPTPSSGPGGTVSPDPPVSTPTGVPEVPADNPRQVPPSEYQEYIDCTQSYAVDCGPPPE